MYFITKRTSETGEKFQKISEKIAVSAEEILAIADKYGFGEYRPDTFSVFGGISSCSGFREEPDTKIWGQGTEEGEYMPKRNTKEGKKISDEINNMPRVSSYDLNMCIGYEEVFNTIGFVDNNEDYFGFSIGENWGVTIPDDCEEVTTSKYIELFK